MAGSALNWWIFLVGLAAGLCDVVLLLLVFWRRRWGVALTMVLLSSFETAALTFIGFELLVGNRFFLDRAFFFTDVMTDPDNRAVAIAHVVALAVSAAFLVVSIRAFARCASNERLRTTLRAPSG
jgi:hypothetical protein